MTSRYQTILSIIAGPVILLAFYVILILVAGKSLDGISEEGFVILFQLVWTSIPFWYLRLAKIGKPTIWIVVTLLTVLFYAATIWQSLEAKEHGTGANIGLGLIFLVLPVLMVAVAKISDLLSKNMQSG